MCPRSELDHREIVLTLFPVSKPLVHRPGAPPHERDERPRRKNQPTGGARSSVTSATVGRTIEEVVADVRLLVIALVSYVYQALPSKPDF